MPDETPRAHWDEKPAGLPWQVIYAAFTGVLLAALLFYGGLIVWGRGGAQSAGAGIAIVVASAALGACFVALITGASWALTATRISTMAAAAAMLARVAFQLYAAAQSREWTLPGARRMALLADAAFQPDALMPLVGLAACAFLLCLLLGPTVRRFCGRA